MLLVCLLIDQLPQRKVLRNMQLYRDNLALQVLLFAHDDGIDLYRTDPRRETQHIGEQSPEDVGVFHSESVHQKRPLRIEAVKNSIFPYNEGESLPTVRSSIHASSTTHLVITDGSGASMLRVGAPKRSTMIGRRDIQLATTDEWRSRMLYTTSRNGQYALHLQFFGCNQERTLPIEHDVENLSLLLSTLKLPVQQRIALSPSSDKAALIDHRHFGHLLVVDLVTQQIRKLKHPDFSRSQVHFSPLFLNNNTLLFSLIDEERWATVSYSIRTNTYDIISQEFNDESLRAADGNLVGIRTRLTHGGANIPFGSVALQAMQTPLQDSDVLRAIEGEPSLQRLLFRKNTNGQYTFLPNALEILERQDVSQRTYNLVMHLWNTQIQKGRSVEIVRGVAGGNLQRKSLIPISSTERLSFVQRETTDTLLSALAIPQYLREEIEKRRAEIVKKGGAYVLIGTL